MPAYIYRHKIVISLSVITLLALILRIHALSVYKFYPDSYVPLVVAENIHDYGSVVAPMGENGLLYPDFLGWTRPTYPLLINLFNIVINNSELTARFLSLLFGVAAIPLAYLFVSTALKSKRSGLIAALLLTISYNHTVWSGFIMSETTGVFLILLTLWLLFRNLHNKYELANWHDLLIGALFGLAILTRYEYAVLIIPIVFIIYFKYPNPLPRLITVAAASSIILASAYFFLSPFYANSIETTHQLSSFLDTVKTLNISGLIKFVTSDILISAFSCVGIYLILRNKEYRKIGIFTVLSLILLEFMYYRVNPDMTRYFTHLLPFLLLSASFAGSYIYEKVINSRRQYKLIGLAVLCCVLLIQSFISYRGLHKEKNGIWFTRGYEEDAAELVSDYIPAESLIIASFPEPYFLQTHNPIQSVADESPFIYISPSLDAETVYIVQDEGMRQIFPNFSAFLDLQLTKYVFKEIPLDTVFRFENWTARFDRPIRLYNITLAELRNIIETNNEINSPNTLLQ